MTQSNSTALARHRELIKWLVRLTGLLLFVYIMTTLDIGQTLAILRRSRLGYLGLAICLVIPLVFFKSVRWWVLLQGQGIEISLRKTVVIYAVGLFGGFITPAQLGDFVKVYYLANEGFSLTKSFLSVAFDRLLDLLLLIMFGSVGTFAFITTAKPYILVAGLLCLFIAVIAFSVLLRQHAGLISQMMNVHVAPKLLRRQIGPIGENSFPLTKSEHTIRLLMIWGLSLLAILTYFSRMYFLALALQINISFVYCIACVAIASLVSLIPVTVAGIGTRDAALIALFARLGINKEYAVSLSVLILFLFIVNGLIGFLAWLKYPRRVVIR